MRRLVLAFALLLSSVYALDLVRVETRVDEAITRFGFTGKGVVFAMLDRGIDWKTKDFRNADGTTRIAYIFDLTDDTGAHASNNPYGVGTVYTRDQINTALKGGPALATRDAVGHGTANTAIAAGNGVNSPGAKYRGIAPNATIIAVKIVSDGAPAHGDQPAEAAFYKPERIPVAIDFVRDKAKELGMPAVMVLDIGSQGGPTDGTSALARKIDATVGTVPGLALIAGAGDDGGSANRARGTVAPNSPALLQFRKGTTGTLALDLWYAGSDRFDVTITTPDTTYGPLPSPANDAADVRTSLGEVAYYHYGANANNSWGTNNGKRELYLAVTGPVGTYTVTLTPAQVTSGRFDATLNPSQSWNDSKANVFLTYAAPGSISDAGSARNAITTAAYVVRTSWTDIDGKTQTADGAGATGQLWTGSSAGPTFDGRNGIDVSAPAQNIITAYSPASYWATFRSNLVQDGNGLYGIAGANSSSNPVVAGIIALMLEANPKLDALTIKDILQKTSHFDAITGIVPNPSWGYGKVDAVAALTAVTATPAPVFTTAGLVNGASFRSGPVAPGEIFTVYGTGMAPLKLVNLALTSDGGISKSLSGTEVFFDGVPAPLIYTSAQQVAGIVPYSVAGKTSTVVQVQYEGVLSAPETVPVAATSPALFMAPGLGETQAAVLNQDYSYNSASRPAARGSVVQLFATGEGQTNPAGVDGKLAYGVYPKPLVPVTATVGSVPAVVLYYGAAPTLVAGVLQVNVKVPATVAPGPAVPVVITVGGVSSPAGTIAVE